MGLSYNVFPMPGVLEEVHLEEVLEEVLQEGDPHQVVGQEGLNKTTTMVSPDLLVEMLELSPLLVRKDIALLYHPAQ